MTIAFLFLLQIVATNWPSLTGGTAGITLPLPKWSIEIQNWPFYYSLAGLLAAVAADVWRIRRTKFGMGLVAMREDEDKAATVGIDTPVYKLLGVRGQRGVRRHGRRGLRLLPGVRRPDRDVQHPAQRPDPALDAARRPRHAVRAGAGRVPDRAAERVVEQQPRRRQLAAADLRRPDGARGAVPAARDHPDAARPASSRGACAARRGWSARGSSCASGPSGSRSRRSGRRCSRFAGSRSASAACARSTAARSRSPRARSPR